MLKILLFSILCSVLCPIIKASIKIKLNEDKTILYLFHDDQCGWVGTFGRNCIATYISGSKVIVSSNTVNELLKSIITEYTWIGGKRFHNETGFTWYNGTPMNYTNWDHGEPDAGPHHRPFDGPDYCTVMAPDGLWYDAPCYYAYHTLRQFTVTPTLGHELLHNISRLERLTIAQEYVKILNEIDASVSTSTENPDAIDEDIASMDKAVNDTNAELEKMEQHHANMNETIESVKSGLRFLLFGMLRFMRDTERSNSRLDARVRENSEYKNGLETQLSQIESNVNENQHAVTNLTSSMENFTMVNGNFTNMLKEFESFIQMKDHSDSRFHTFVTLYFVATIFVVFGLVYYTKFYRKYGNNSVMFMRSADPNTPYESMLE